MAVVDNRRWNQGYPQLQKSVEAFKEQHYKVTTRFGSKPLDKHLVELMKLKQLGTVEQYQKRFEALLTGVDLPVGEVVSCFLNGLRGEIQIGVRMFKPQTFYEALCLAKLQEATLAFAKKTTPILNRPPSPLRIVQEPPLQQSTILEPRSDNLKQEQGPPMEVKNGIATQLESAAEGKPTCSCLSLSPAEIFAKWDKGLCELCDEPYDPGHKCKKIGKHLVFVVAEEEDSLQSEFGVDNRPAMDAPQVFDESPKPSTCIKLEGRSGNDHEYAQEGLEIVPCEQLGGSNPSNGLFEKSISSIHDKDPALCEQEELGEDVYSEMCTDEELCMSVGNSKELGLSSLFEKQAAAMPGKKDPNLLECWISKNPEWKEISEDGQIEDEAFSTCGNILSCKGPADESGQSKGYGFVQYDNEESGQKAIEKLNGMLLNDQPVDVGPFLRKKERENAIDKTRTRFTNVCVKNLAETTTDEDLENICGQYGETTNAVVWPDIDRNLKCLGFVDLGNANDAVKVVEMLNGQKYDEKEWCAGKAQKKAEREAGLKQKFEQTMRETVVRLAFDPGEKTVTTMLSLVDLFFWRSPFGGEYISFVSLEECKRFAAHFRFTEEESKMLLEFELKRAQGPVGGVSASRYCYLSDSNLAAGRLSGIAFISTHSHALVGLFMKPEEIMETLLCSVDGLTIWEDFVGLVHTWLHKSQRLKVLVEDQLKIKLLDGSDLGRVKLQQVFVQVQQKLPQASHVQLYTTVGVKVAPILLSLVAHLYRCNNSDKTVLVRLPGSGEILLYCPLQRGSSHQGIVTPRDPNDSAFGLHSETLKGEKFQQIPLLIVCHNFEQVSAHSRELTQFLVKALGGTITGSSKRIMFLCETGFVFDPGGKKVSKHIGPSPTELGYMLDIDDLGTGAAKPMVIPVRELGRKGYKAVVFLLVLMYCRLAEFLVAFALPGVRLVFDPGGIAVDTHALQLDSSATLLIWNYRRSKGYTMDSVYSNASCC